MNQEQAIQKYIEFRKANKGKKLEEITANAEKENINILEQTPQPGNVIAVKTDYNNGFLAFDPSIREYYLGKIDAEPEQYTERLFITQKYRSKIHALPMPEIGQIINVKIKPRDASRDPSGTYNTFEVYLKNLQSFELNGNERLPVIISHVKKYETPVINYKGSVQKAGFCYAHVPRTIQHLQKLAKQDPDKALELAVRFNQNLIEQPKIGMEISITIDFVSKNPGFWFLGPELESWTGFVKGTLAKQNERINGEIYYINDRTKIIYIN